MNNYLNNAMCLWLLRWQVYISWFLFLNLININFRLVSSYISFRLGIMVVTIFFCYRCFYDLHSLLSLCSPLLAAPWNFSAACWPYHDSCLYLYFTFTILIRHALSLIYVESPLAVSRVLTRLWLTPPAILITRIVQPQTGLTSSAAMRILAASTQMNSSNIYQERNSSQRSWYVKNPDPVQLSRASFWDHER